MIVWAILATLVAAVAISLLIFYRRQVKKTCRRLRFIKEQDSNLSLPAELPFAELDELADSINDMLALFRRERLAAKTGEETLKETIVNLSHDIRTPLTSLDGYFQLLADSPSPKERAHYLDVIQSRLRSLKEMLEELFTYAKLQDENYMPALTTVHFSQCVHHVLFSFYDEFKAKGIEPFVDFCDEALTVCANEEALARVLQNIIKNALLHGHSAISFRLYQENGHALFECANDVKEPDAIDMNQIFGRFYKADTARTHVSTGLGLAIAQGLSRRMGGQVSAQLRGAVFSVCLQLPILS